MKSYGLSPEIIAALRNPTREAALRFWPYHLVGDPIDETAPLAGLHKARLEWGGSTKAMVRESKAWLREHGYGFHRHGDARNATAPRNCQFREGWRQ